MKIHLEKIGDDGLDLDEPVTGAWLTEVLGPNSAFQPAQDGHLKVHLTRVDDVVNVYGKAAIDLKATCARCLAPVTITLRTPIQVTMVPRVPEPSPDNKGELAEEDLGIATYENKEIDLACVVRDEVFLELPMQALCSEDCAGLCAQCGKNLNEGACGCKPVVDHRWGPLQRLKFN